MGHLTLTQDDLTQLAGAWAPDAVEIEAGEKRLVIAARGCRLELDEVTTAGRLQAAGLDLHVQARYDGELKADFH